MKKIAIGCIPLVMLLFLLNFSGKAFCATKQQQYQQQQNQGAQVEDEADNEEYEAPAGQQQYQQRQNQDDQMEDEDQADDEVFTAPPGTLFKNIAKGMSYQHVTDLIGPPNDTKEYMTGKHFIPFYMGTDTVRLEAIYKGQGRITFTGRPLRVYHIVDNPNESGYNE
jgi:hypothetical protein